MSPVVSVSESEKKTNPRSTRYRKSTTINESLAGLAARHIPLSILLEDVAAFTQSLARPDRPNLVRGRSLQFVFTGGDDNIGGGKKGEDISSATTTYSSSSLSSSSRHRAALRSLSLLAPTIGRRKQQQEKYGTRKQMIIFS